MPTGRAARRTVAVLLAGGALLAVAGPPAGAAVRPKPSPAFVLPRPTSTLGGAGLDAPGVLVHLPAGRPAPPKVAAAAWLIADLDTGAVLAAVNPHVPLAPASTLKILTAVTLSPRMSPGTVYAATAADADADGSKVGLVAGSRYTVDNLMHGLLLGSGNDAASALAGLAGGMANTARLMNQTAVRLQACDTRAVNDSGLDAPGQVSSAYDLALFGRAALADPRVATILRTTTYTFPAAGTSTGTGTAHRRAFQIQNHNRLLRNYPGATGVKNGFTEAARGSFIGSATRGGHSYVATLLRAEGSTWHDVSAMLDWAFATGSSVAPVGRLADPVPAGRPTACLAAAPLTSPSPGPTAVIPVAGAAPPSASVHRVAHRPGQWAAAGLAAGAGMAGGIALRSRRRRRIAG